MSRPAEKSRHAEPVGNSNDAVIAPGARHRPEPTIHQSGSAPVGEVTSTRAVKPTRWSTPAGGTNDAIIVNGGPESEAHAPVLIAAPAAPQSSHDRLMPEAAWST